MERSASPCPAPARRQVATGLAWAVPVVVVASAAPYAAATPDPCASIEVPPSAYSAECAALGPGPLAPAPGVTGFTMPPDGCNGEDWSGAFTFSLNNPTGTAYALTVVGLSVQTREIFPGMTVSAWTPLACGSFAVTGLGTATTVAPNGFLNGGGSVLGIPPQAGIVDTTDADGNTVQSVQNVYRVDYWLQDASLPSGGCAFSVVLDWLWDCP